MSPIPVGTLVRLRTSNGGDALVRVAVSDYRESFGGFFTHDPNGHTFYVRQERVRDVCPVPEAMPVLTEGDELSVMVMLLRSEVLAMFTNARVQLGVDEWQPAPMPKGWQ